MREQMGQVDDERNETDKHFDAAEVEIDQAINGVREKEKINDTDAYLSRKVSELQAELNSVHQTLMKTKEELKIKEGNIESLKYEIQKAKDLELKLAEKDASLEWLKGEIDVLKASHVNMNDGKIHEIIVELGKRKESEANMFDSLVAQTKQLEETKILLEEARLEINFLQNKLMKLEGTKGNRFSCESQGHSVNHSNGRIPSPNKKSKLRSSVSFTDKVESRFSPLQTKNLLLEVDVLKNELTMATQAEEKSKKAMDDLALALKEVATENKHMKEKLTFYRVELERTKDEACRLRLVLKSTEEKYREVAKEAEKYKNTAERLQLEAEESSLAWNEKETEFVNCIKRAEEDIEELVEKLETCEKKSKDESMKLRDILKQALSEANIAKEAAEIARAENSYLQDSLAAIEQDVDLLTRENELLKINEAVYLENINELKRIISGESPTQESEKDDEGKRKQPVKESKIEDKEAEKKTNVHHDSVYHKEPKVEVIGLALRELKIPAKDKVKVHGEREPSLDTESDLATGNESFHSPESGFHPDLESIPSEEFEHLDEQNLVHGDDKNWKKKKALLRRVGDILKRRTFHRKESSDSSL